MASEKNITMRQFNGTDYDTLYPKTKVEQVEGAYTQQQILADSTKGAYGLGSTAIPDDVFALIGKYNQYWWSYTPEAKFISVNAVQTNYILQSTSSDSTKVTWYYGTSYTFDNNTGKYTISNQSSISRDYTQNLNELKGTYCMQSASSGKKMLYLSSDVSISQSYANTYNLVASSCTIYSASLETVTTTYYHSSDRNAYSESDGYVYLGIPLDNAVTAPKVVNGSYVGTGSGSVQLTFDATPQLIVVGGVKNSNNTEGFLVAPRGTGTVAVAGNGDSNYYAYVSWGDNSVSLSGSNYYNPNVSGRTYHYTAIIYG